MPNGIHGRSYHESLHKRFWLSALRRFADAAAKVAYCCSALVSSFALGEVGDLDEILTPGTSRNTCEGRFRCPFWNPFDSQSRWQCHKLSRILPALNKLVQVQAITNISPSLWWFCWLWLRSLGNNFQVPRRLTWKIFDVFHATL